LATCYQSCVWIRYKLSNGRQSIKEILLKPLLHGRKKDNFYLEKLHDWSFLWNLPFSNSFFPPIIYFQFQLNIRKKRIKRGYVDYKSYKLHLFVYRSYRENNNLDKMVDIHHIHILFPSFDLCIYCLRMVFRHLVGFPCSVIRSVTSSNTSFLAGSIINRGTTFLRRSHDWVLEI
jgi:hypothetical protein